MAVRLTSLMPCSLVPRGTASPAAPPTRTPGRGQLRALTGNDAVALAFKQVDPHLTAAYPITPQTELMHKFAEYVAQGDVRTELINVESEHSAMSAVLAAAAAGCRTFTATSAVGLAHMMEVYQNAGALRLPIVLSLVNRHAGGLLNIHNDHGDAMLARNSAWVQMHAENAQEAYDNVLQAFRIAEDDRVRLPVTICHDGFIVSHTMERLLTLSDHEVKSFVGEFIPSVDLLDVENPQAVGPLVLPDFAPGLYAQIAQAMRWAPAVIEEVGQEYELLSGRPGGLLEAYRMADAEVAVVAMGSICGTVRAMVDRLRSRGVPAGMVKLRVFRPFPADAVARALSSTVRAVAVLDKTPELGSGGPLFGETTAALALHARTNNRPLPVMINTILGIGGRDVTLADINGVFDQLLGLAAGGTQPSADPVYFLDTGDQGPKLLESDDGRADVEGADDPNRQIVLLARGGQGARTSCYLIAETMIELGHYAQAFPAYGPERTGAPVRAFAKLSPHPIDDRQQIYSADAVVVFDEKLLETLRADIEHLAPQGVLIVNTRKKPRELRKELTLVGRRICTVDATGIAVAEFGANRPNTPMLAAMTKVLGLGDLDRLKQAFAAKMKRLSDKVLQGNFRAMDRATEEVKSE